MKKSEIIINVEDCCNVMFNIFQKLEIRSHKMSHKKWLKGILYAPDWISSHQKYPFFLFVIFFFTSCFVSEKKQNSFVTNDRTHNIQEINFKLLSCSWCFCDFCNILSLFLLLNFSNYTTFTSWILKCFVLRAVSTKSRHLRIQQV